MAVKAPCYDKTMNSLKWFVIFALLGYGSIVALLYVTQRAMQYFPERFRTAPAAAGAVRKRSGQYCSERCAT